MNRKTVSTTYTLIWNKTKEDYRSEYINEVTIPLYRYKLTNNAQVKIYFLGNVFYFFNDLRILK